MTCIDELTLMMHLDGELETPEVRQVLSHLDACPQCRARALALVCESETLFEVLSEPEASHVQSTEKSTRWLFGSIGVCVLAPLVSAYTVHILPAPPAALAWLGNFLKTEGLSLLFNSLFFISSGAHSMVLPLSGFAATLLATLAFLASPAIHRRALGSALATAALLFIAFSPTQAGATKVRIDEGSLIEITADETIEDSVLFSGETVLIKGRIDGDVIAFAEHIEITGVVHGNIYGGGGTVKLAGDVHGNVHLVGGRLDIEGKVDGSAYLVGEKVSLNAEGELGREGIFAGESVRVRGQVARGIQVAAKRLEIAGGVTTSVKAYVDSMVVTPSAVIGGTLKVTAPSKNAVEVQDGASVAGPTSIELSEHETHSYLQASFYFSVLAQAIAMLLVGLLFFNFLPSWPPPLPESSADLLRKMGVGFIVLVATPLTIIVLAATIIGIPIAALLGMLYICVAYFATPVVAYFITLKTLGAEHRYLILGMAFCLLAILLLAELPLIGFGLNFLVHLLGVGALVIHFKGRYKPEP